MTGGEREENREGFLMYRVELKVAPVCRFPSPSSSVPNVPCGVEREIKRFVLALAFMFLMYRVELKGPQGTG